VRRVHVLAVVIALASAGPLGFTGARAADAPAATAPIAEIWTLDTISFETPADRSILGTFESDHSMGAITSRLDKLGIKYERKQGTLDVSKAPRSMVAQILAQPPTEPWMLPSGNATTVNVIVSRRQLSETAGLALAPSVASAQSAAAIAAAPVPLSLRTKELVETVSTRAEYEQQFTNTFLSAFDRSLSQNGGTAAIEAKMPGIVKAMRTALSQEIARQMSGEYDHYVGTLGALYQATLTDTEMDATVAFYRSPTGQRMLARAKASMANSVNQMAQNGQPKDPRSEIQSMTGTAAVASIQDLSEEDLKALAAFSAQPGTIKLAQAQPKFVAVAADETQGAITRLTPTFRTVIDKVMAQYRSKK
jgi:hypothetical protein